MGIQLTYCSMETEEIRRFRKEMDVQELEQWFAGLIHEYVKWAQFQYHHPVSYTHLDVYKRQILESRIKEGDHVLISAEKGELTFTVLPQESALQEKELHPVS